MQRRSEKKSGEAEYGSRQGENAKLAPREVRHDAPSELRVHSPPQRFRDRRRRAVNNRSEDIIRAPTLRSVPSSERPSHCPEKPSPPKSAPASRIGRQAGP